MRRFAFLFWFFSFVFPALHAETIIKEIAGEGAVFQSNPSGAKVFVDGIERGKTPLTLPQLPAGSYSVLLTKDNYEDWTQKISFSYQSRLQVSVDLVPVRGEVQIRLADGATKAPLESKNARILVERLPLTPEIIDGTLVFRLSEGQKLISARFFGYNEAKKTIAVKKDTVTELFFELEPAQLSITRFSLNRAVFNPLNTGNLGTVTANFTVSTSARGRLLVYSEEGALVFESSLGLFEDWSQHALWDGGTFAGNIAAEGRYRLRVEAVSEKTPAGGTDFVFEERWVKVDYSAAIIPLSLLRGLPGLSNAEAAAVLPASAFQISTALTASGLSSALFAAGFRWSPVSTLEAAFAAHFGTKLEGRKNGELAFSAAVKKELWKSRRLRPALSAGVYYGWVNGERVTSAGLDAGAAINLALSWDFPAGFSLLAAPSLLWTGSAGFPAEAAPRGAAGGGILWRSSAVVAGISARAVFALAAEARSAPEINISTDFFFYPPPANLTFGLIAQSGISQRGVSFSGGILLGILY
ncbi:MAG: PEGA domain-containing protein [Spirochaetaceae bacterium]|jgi:hypothetical protein|nr:PEGA domain-containing protein [Spirochaetaceae bacterium]